MADLLPVIVGVDHWEDLTHPFLITLQAHNPGLRVVVVDNGSDTPYPEWYDYDLLRIEPRVGYGVALNEAARAYPGRQYMFLNNDCLCEGRFMEKAAALDPKTVWGSAASIDKGNPTGLVQSAWLIISPEIWEKVGEFDERCEAAYEDFDYERRAVKQGYGVDWLNLPIRHLDAHTRLDTGNYRRRWTLSMEHYSDKHGLPRAYWWPEEMHR